MERLWTPWRLEYVTGAASNMNDDCVFCVACNGDAQASLLLHRGKRVYVILNKYPYNNGHLMVVPFRHIGRMADADSEELSETPDKQVLIDEISVDTIEIVKEVTALYVNINNLKLRSSPDLKSEVVGELKLGSKVIFAGEVTDSLYTINLGKKEVTEPYVKVKTWKGLEGWESGMTESMSTAEHRHE